MGTFSTKFLSRYKVDGGLDSSFRTFIDGNGLFYYHPPAPDSSPITDATVIFDSPRPPLYKDGEGLVRALSAAVRKKARVRPQTCDERSVHRAAVMANFPYKVTNLTVKDALFESDNLFFAEAVAALAAEPGRPVLFITADSDLVFAALLVSAAMDTGVYIQNLERDATYYVQFRERLTPDLLFARAAPWTPADLMNAALYMLINDKLVHGDDFFKLGLAAALKLSPNMSGRTLDHTPPYELFNAAATPAAAQATAFFWARGQRGCALRADGYAGLMFDLLARDPGAAQRAPNWARTMPLRDLLLAAAWACSTFITLGMQVTDEQCICDHQNIGLGHLFVPREALCAVFCPEAAAVLEQRWAAAAGGAAPTMQDVVNVMPAFVHEGMVARCPALRAPRSAVQRAVYAPVYNLFSAIFPPLGRAQSVAEDRDVLARAIAVNNSDVYYAYSISDGIYQVVYAAIQTGSSTFSPGAALDLLSSATTCII